MTSEPLPDTRRSVTTKLIVGGNEVYVTAGLYEDGRLGELFIRTAKAGSTVRGLLESISILTSVSLQHGVPVDLLCDKMIGMRFDPMDHIYTSVVDLIFKWVKENFGSKEDNER